MPISNDVLFLRWYKNDGVDLLNVGTQFSTEQSENTAVEYVDLAVVLS